MRLFNLSLNSKKKIYILLQQIFGINRYSALVICKTLGFNSLTSASALRPRHISVIKQFVLTRFKVSSDLERVLATYIGDLISIKSYRGFRHRLKLPVRGQRTHTNRQTQKKK